MLTLFTFGYWGWGNATDEFIRVVDATERARGFKPPVFYDIRASRSVRAAGFRGDAFERHLPNGRYQWFPRLGNARITSHEPGIKIADPFSAKILLEEVLLRVRDRRRIIFFCACEFPRYCHRHVVARLVLEEASRIGRQVQIVEWPGGTVTRKAVKVDDATFAAIERGLANVPLGERPQRDNLCLPWGSIVDVRSHGSTFPVITGPAHFRGRWVLPIYERCEPEAAKRLRLISEEFRRRRGLQPQDNLPTKKPKNTRPKVLTIRQPWAHAIVHLGKDVENRSWRANYKGRLLIHASAQADKNPRKLLRESMPSPPSEDALSRIPTGCIIGVADVFDYVQDSRSPWAIRGQWHWLLRNVHPIKPIPCVGRLGLWTPSAALIRKLPSWARRG